MRRLLASAALLGAFALPGTAAAEPLGECSGTVDAVCVHGSHCDPDWCYRTICLVWHRYRCLVGDTNGAR